MLNVGMFLADRYEILGKVGAGGMSDVYKAKDHILSRIVAIKVLKSEFSEDRTFVTKFRTEAQSAAVLEHPNIVNIYDVGSEDGLYYIVMEYVEGITLKTYIEKKGQLSFKESASIAIQVARGIEAAHGKNIIHRDIKPQNIMISTDGKVKVTDFGIAKAASSNTISSDVMGSVHYASPEQARNGFIDARSDVYSLGIVMYEMITGRVPFDGDTTVAVAIQHLQEEIVKPSVYAPNIPVSFEGIILKCTQKTPDRRYQSMAELLNDLRHALTNPNENFVVIAPLVDNSRTKVIAEEDLKEIKERGFTAEDDPDTDLDADVDDIDDEDDGDDKLLNPKMDKAVTIMGIVTAVIILIVVVYLIGSIFGLFRFGSSKNTETETETQTETETEIEMIKVIGMTVDEAQAKLEDMGITVVVSGTQESDEEAGTILSQDPKEGSMIAQNSTVKVVVAGQDTTEADEIDVPSVVGKTKSEAETAIKNAKFNYKETYEYSADVAADVVISQSPASGKLAEGSTIEIVISQGEQSKTVPNVFGYAQSAAQSSLTAAGLNYSVKTDYSDSVAEGNVISQDVEAGKTVAPGTTVTITVSLGSNTKYYSFSYTLNYTLGHETQDNTETGEAGKKVTGFSAVLKDGSGNTIEGASWNSNMTSNDSYNMTADNIKNTASGNLVVTWSYSDGSTEDQTIGVSFNAK
ncbi:MAG: Stk1 family PASTA domain-containing Ser/Thr kinase [Lachnobacterium sp.]|nr:Stk1 family PASTA domain-containing Ser/Thr kinase [Lachnobacterium sp.]